MNLGELILELEVMKTKFGEDHVFTFGFGNPHSWRGSYNELCFEPVENVSIGEMLVYAKSALNKYYEGWKGGLYKMDQFTPCHLNTEGNCGADDIITDSMIYIIRTIEYWPSWVPQPSSKLPIGSHIPEGGIVCPDCDGKIFKQAPIHANLEEQLCKTCNWLGFIIPKVIDNTWEL